MSAATNSSRTTSIGGHRSSDYGAAIDVQGFASVLGDAATPDAVWTVHA